MGGVPASHGVSLPPVTFSPPSGSTLYNDRLKVSSEQYVIERDLFAKSTPSSDISTLQKQYNADLAQYKSDLETDLKNIHPGGKTDGPGSRTPPLTALQLSNRDYDNSEISAIDGTAANSYHRLTFTDSGAGANALDGTVNGSSFNGAVDPEVFVDPTTNEGTQHVQAGYVTPPAISSGSDLAEVYANLTPDQAAYLGWSLEQTEQGKQVSIPTGDLKSWNLLSDYALENDNLLEQPYTGDDTEGDYSGPSEPGGDPDEEVNSAFKSNQPTDPGAIALQAFTGLFTLGVPADIKALIPGQAGSVLSALAFGVISAFTGIALGGEVTGSIIGATTFSFGGATIDLANVAKTIQGIIGAGGLSEAGEVLLSGLGDSVGDFLTGTTPDSFSIQDNFDKN